MYEFQLLLVSKSGIVFPNWCDSKENLHIMKTWYSLIIYRYYSFLKQLIITFRGCDKLLSFFQTIQSLIYVSWFCYRGKDVSVENLHQGYTHVFESTFETTEGIAAYISHPAHVEFATVFLDQLEKVLVVDYKPTSVEPWAFFFSCM